MITTPISPVGEASSAPKSDFTGNGTGPFPTANAAIALSPVADAQVVEGYPSNNYGTTTNMYVQSDSASLYLDERAWMRFDLNGQIPPGATINSATLRLYCWRANGANLDIETRSSTVDTWGETTITWSNQPAYGAPLSSVTCLVGVTGVWYEWPVTSFVQGQMAGDKTVSFCTKAVTEGYNPARSYSFDSKEYSSSVAPQLLVDYTGEWPVSDTFRIFHVNDMHGRILPHDMNIVGKSLPESDYAWDEVGGGAYLATKMLELKAAYPESLVLDAGDISEGNPLGDLRGNGGMVDFMSVMDSELKTLGGRGIDAAVVGNHDFRNQTYLNNMAAAPFPVVSMNVCNEGTMTPYFDAYVTVTVNGTKVGILGFTNDAYGDEGSTLIDVVPCVWDDANASTIDVLDYVNTLRTTEACDVVILLAHVGHTRIVSGTDALLVDGGGVLPPEICVTGHWHSWDETVWLPTSLNGKTLIAESSAFCEYIGEVHLSGLGKYLDSEKHIIKCSDITPNPNVNTLISTLWAEYNASSPAYELEEVIGYSGVDLTLDDDNWWSQGEFPWSGDNTAGAWVCDGMKWKGDAIIGGIELAVQSGGGIRRDVKAGWITFREIYETYPWEDDEMVKIEMTGQEIWDFIDGTYCGASMSKDWVVHASDGIIDQIYYMGSPINLAGFYDAVISEYMYANDGPFIDTTPIYTGVRIRDSVIEYTSQFTDANPMDVPGPRYVLDTELAGGFDVVVTFMNDADSSPVFEGGFIRLLNATPDTVRNRERYGADNLVRADGSINPLDQFVETQWYRSSYGFTDGLVKHGDMFRIYGEGGCFAGNPQLVEQSGIVNASAEFLYLGNDPSKALPDYKPTINSFRDEWHENHYVKFYATQASATSVTDSAATTITAYQPGGYYTYTLPGVTGDLLELTGTMTYRYTEWRFRVHTATVVTNGFRPTSSVDAISPYLKSVGSVPITATASDSGGSITQVQFLYRYSADNATFGAWTPISTDASAPYTASLAFMNGQGYYEVCSRATDNSGNIEETQVYADASCRYYVDAVAPTPPTGLSVDHFGREPDVWTRIFNEPFTGTDTTWTGDDGGEGGVTAEWWFVAEDTLDTGDIKVGSYNGNPYPTGLQLSDCDLGWASQYAEGRYGGTNAWFPISSMGASAAYLNWSMCVVTCDTGDYWRLETTTDGANWNIAMPQTAGNNPATWSTISYQLTAQELASASWGFRFNTFSNGADDIHNFDNVTVEICQAGTGSDQYDNTLNWTKSADDGGGVNDVALYNIYRSNSQTGPWDVAHLVATMPSGIETYQDDDRGLTDGITWWYVVRAKDTSGNEETNTNSVPEPSPGDTPYAINLTGKAANSWVFVSFPSGLTGNIQTILNDATAGDGLTTWTVAKWYNVQTPADPWKTYRVGSAVNDMPTMTNTMGVWLYITANGGDQKLTLSSYTANSSSNVVINLYAGWNMVGYPSATSRAESATLPAQADFVASWQAASPFITQHAKGATLMISGNAYWVHVTADCTWAVVP